MTPHFYPLFFYFFFILIFIDTALCDVDKAYKFAICSVPFMCGNIGDDIGYPFWGGGRAEFCGHPGYQLYCLNDGSNSTIEIEISSVRYQVLNIIKATQTMSIVRKDFLDDACPSSFSNFTFNAALFRFASTTTNLTLFYDCDAELLPRNQFDCTINNNVTITNYYNEAPRRQLSSSCRWTIVVQVFRAAFERLMRNRSSVEDVLKEGFDVEYVVDVSLCEECQESGGKCGFDSDTQKPICFCLLNDAHSSQSRCRPLPPANSFGGVIEMRKIIMATAFTVGGLTMVTITFAIVVYRLIRKSHPSKLRIFFRKHPNNAQKVEAILMSYESLSPRRYKYSDIKKVTNSFRDKLGQGGYGSVYKGRLLDGRMVAVKLLSELKGNGDEFVNEVASISRTSHVNIVTLIGFCVEGSKRALIYEFMPNGSLEKFIYDRIRPHLGWKMLYDIALGIARGLEYLHRGCNTRILHFDIKPHNILLDQDFCPKISDFGLSKLCLAKESIISITGARGTVGYIAPEVLFRNFGAVSHKSDVYSYGIMVLEIVGGRENIDVGAANSSEIYFPHWIYNKIDQSKDLGLQQVTSAEDEEIARKMILVGLWCIQIHPSNRPSMNQVLDMLEGSLEGLQIPPKPFLPSPLAIPISSFPRQQDDLSTISASS